MNHQRTLSTAVLTACLSLLAAGCSDSGGAATPPPTPDATAEWVAKGMAANEPQRAWGALPATYQRDVNDLVHEFAGKMDKDVWNKSFAVLDKLAKMLKSKKELILNSDMMKDPSIDRDQLAANWDHLVGLQSTLANSALADLDKLKTADVGKILGDSGSQFMKHFSALSAAAKEDPVAMFSQMKASVVKQEGDTATVKMEVPDKPAEEQVMVRVEGKWIPKEMADGWADGVADAKKSLSEFSSEQMNKAKPQIMGLLTMLEGTIDQMAKAENAQQFEAAAQQAQQTVGMAVMGMMMSGMQNQSQGGPLNPPIDLNGSSAPPDGAPNN